MSRRYKKIRKYVLSEPVTSTQARRSLTALRGDRFRLGPAIRPGKPKVRGIKVAPLDVTGRLLFPRRAYIPLTRKK